MNYPVQKVDALEISPEALEIANIYLKSQNIDDVASETGLTKSQVLTILDRREVKSYIDQVFFNVGFNNKFTIRKALDTIIAKKFQEMDEAGVGSEKDIADLLQLSHKITMDQLQKEIELEKVRASKITTQTNVQINGELGSNYAALLGKLLKPNDK
jgi:hypothetical protein